VQRAHERFAHACATCRAHDADSADPRVVAPNTEVAQPDGDSVSEGDPRGVRIEVKSLGHRRDGALVDVERNEVAVVRGVEQLRALTRRE
jgi:hypothetical protein